MVGEDAAVEEVDSVGEGEAGVDRQNLLPVKVAQVTPLQAAIRQHRVPPQLVLPTQQVPIRDRMDQAKYLHQESRHHLPHPQPQSIPVPGKLQKMVLQILFMSKQDQGEW